MESFSESVVSPSSERAHRVISPSEETSSSNDKSSVDDDEEEEEESPLILCFFGIDMDSFASSSSQ
jgi:hypothetical protein